MNPTATRVPRSVRREINQAIKADAKEQQHAHALERARMQRAVIEYRWRRVQDSPVHAWDTQETWFERRRELAVAHDRLRTSIYNTAHLTAVERGQVSQAIDGIHADRHAPIKDIFGKPSGLTTLRAKLADGLTRLRAGLAGPAEQRRLQQWNDLHAERAAQAEQRRHRPDWLFTPDPNQPIAYVPTDYPGLHRDPASGVPRPITVRDLTKRIGRYSELRFGPDHGNPTPEDMAAYDRRASEYRDVLIADAHHLGAEHAELMATALNNIDLAYGIRRDGQALLQEQGIESAHPNGSNLAEQNERLARQLSAMTAERDDLREINGELTDRLGAQPDRSPNPDRPRGDVAEPTPAAAPDALHATYAAMREAGRERSEQERPDSPVGRDQVQQDPGYEVVVGTTEFVTKHPEMVDRGTVSTLSDGYGWALNQIGNDKQGWPADAELAVSIYRPGNELPVFSTTGPRGMVTDEVSQARTEHNRTPLAELEQLRAELHAAHAENDQLRTENTNLVREFAEHDLNAQRPAHTAAMPAPGPKLARPIFHGPVLPRPAMNGMDR
ncbi:hypothetical protein AB0C65_32820 [Nocardia sp. NPDC048505]|uniref:hypothetical protein n=1 Tax=Nocardia sp. NPDC048505 TaxID=3155756 RepID=UPI0033D3FF52